ncbi:nuclear pore complex protein Nup85 [Sarcoptes scabiei]|nr:nuclear pore complex protein Nup85 [Sarcoptes scabiei]
MFVDELQPIELLRNFSTTSIPIEIFSKSFDDDNQLSDQNSIIDRNNQSIEIRRIDSFEELELLNKNWQILIITLYTLTAIVALIGNLIAICVLVFGRRSSKELRFFLVNLSLSDILMAIFSIPFTYLDFMLGRWIFAPSFCPIVQQIQITCVIVSVYTLTAIGIDRYIAIIYPLFSQRYSRSFVPIVLILIWSFGLLIGLYQWSNTIAKPFQVANETAYDCTEIAKDQSQMFTIVSFVLTFALPVSILTFVYFSMGHKIFRHSTPGNSDLVRDRQQQSSKIKIIKMLVTIVVLFVVCWLPLHVLNLFIYFARDLLEKVFKSQIGFTIYVAISFTAHWFSVANSFVNPFIYCFMSENFRI